MAFSDYLEKKALNQRDLAAKIGAKSATSITDWKTMAIPGWAMLNLLTLRPDARDFFLAQKPLVISEEEEIYRDSRKSELLRLVKELLREADDELLATMAVLLQRLVKSSGGGGNEIS